MGAHSTVAGFGGKKREIRQGGRKGERQVGGVEEGCREWERGGRERLEEGELHEADRGDRR